MYNYRVEYILDCSPYIGIRIIIYRERVLCLEQFSEKEKQNVRERESTAMLLQYYYK